MPVAGGTTLKFSKALLAPAQELVALAVALELALGVDRGRRRRVPKASTWTEWSMTSSAGTSGLIFAGSPPSVGHRVAHRREVDDGGDAGEVLHEHAGRREGDLLGWARAFASHDASASMSAAVTAPLPSVRSRFSSRIFSEYGSRATSNWAWSASRRKISRSRPPAERVALASKLFVDMRARLLRGVDAEHRSSHDASPGGRQAPGNTGTPARRAATSAARRTPPRRPRRRRGSRRTS